MTFLPEFAATIRCCRCCSPRFGFGQWYSLAPWYSSWPGWGSLSLTGDAPFSHAGSLHGGTTIGAQKFKVLKEGCESVLNLIYTITWNWLLRSCIRFRSRSFDSSRLRFLSLAFRAPFFRLLDAEFPLHVDEVRSLVLSWLALLLPAPLFNLRVLVGALPSSNP